MVTPTLRGQPSEIVQDVPGATRLVREDVFHRLRRDVLTCVLRPGSQIQEKELAERYQVSKSPVRDALLRLQEQNLVEVLPRKGYRVKPISISEIREMYEMRQILERASVARLIEHASDAELKTLDGYRRLPAPDLDLESWVAHNREFHTRLAQLSGNSYLARAASETIAQFDRFIFAQFERAPYLHSDSKSAALVNTFVAEHANLIDAMQRRDRRAALSLLQEHVESSEEMLLARIGTLSVVP